MHSLPNIEPSGFHKGEYVGYGAGKVWRVKRTSWPHAGWRAYPCKPASPERDLAVPELFAPTLKALSAKLDVLKS